MTCRELTALLVEDYEGDLDPEIQEVMDRHRAICPQCESFLRTYRATIRLTATALREPLDPGAQQDLSQGILAALDASTAS